MDIETLVLGNENKVMQAYNHEEQFIHTFFDYKNESESYPKRLMELSNRPYLRKELSSVIRSFMEPFGISENASNHIDELSENGVVVIGGQQAGVMTGPLYSVHKAITVILLAAQKRQELNIPVIPVFWVAGEDHDLNEINHVYTETVGKVTKHQYREKFVLKLMASDASYSQKQMVSFVEEIFRQFGEAEFTKSLMGDVLEAVTKENTFTGFFVRLMNGLFNEQGLLFIDSAYKPLREIEKNHFSKFIAESSELTELIVQKEALFEDAGFGRPIQVERDAANLFYIHETGRVLLSRDNRDFVNSSTGIRFSEEELMTVANEEPWLLSNNVATRPMMQDLVFPVLAFVGGPGEIAYWALLKEAFHHVGIKMPILVPRISMTLVTPSAREALNDLSLTIMDVLDGTVQVERNRFVESLRNDCFENRLEETELQLERQYKELAADASLGMQKLLQQNLKFHKRQFEFLRNKAEEEVLIKNEVVLRKYRILENELLPEGSLQERIFTPYSFMNHYGSTLVQELLRLPFEMDGTHKVVYL